MERERARMQKGQKRNRKSSSAKPAKEPANNTFVKKLLLFITFAGLAVGGGVLGAFLTSEEANAEGMFDQVASLFEKEPEPVLIELEPFVTNLKKTDNSRQGLISMTMALEVLGEENAALVESRQAVIRDLSLQLLNKVTVDKVYEKGDSEDLVIKQEIKEMLNEELGEGVIENTYITDIVTQ